MRAARTTEEKAASDLAPGYLRSHSSHMTSSVAVKEALTSAPDERSHARVIRSLQAPR